MRSARIALFLLISILLFGSVNVMSQDETQTSPVTVKTRQTYKGLVVLTILKATKTFELSCNEGLRGCTSLEPGKYVMVELPKNRGMYECDNVELYPDGTQEPDPDKRLGSYCMSPK